MLTPDGVRYTTPGRTARPFHYRWLLPALCGAQVVRWRVVAYASAAAFCALLWAYTGEWWAPVVALGLSGVIGFNVKHPVLVDLPAMALALGAVVALEHGWWPVAVALVLVSGTVKESGPVFASLWAWNPALLVGLVPVVVRAFQKSGPDPLAGYPEHVEILAHPVRSAWRFHRDLPLWVYVLPWGVCLMARPSWQLGAVLLVSYAQCLVATDTVRLYQWAAPVMIAQTVLQVEWLPVLLVLHLVNPFRTEGV